MAQQKFLQGIDISVYQSNISSAEWAQIKSQLNATFAFARASYGLDGQDRLFDQNWQGIKQAGLIRGAYFFFLFNQDPIKQARYFYTLLQNAGGLHPDDLPPVVDLEWPNSSGQFPYTPANASAAALAFLSELSALTQRLPMVYTSHVFWQECLQDNNFGKYPLWVADYNISPPHPIIPSCWKDWTFWQYTGNGILPGTKINVDQNTFKGYSLADLNNFIKSSLLSQVPA